MKHEDIAVNYYLSGFNCSQSVFTTYAKELGFDEQMALKLGTNFGGGARKGELCGAVSGALLVIGLRCGHSVADDMETKAYSYKVSEEFMTRFINKNGSSVCRALLGYDLTKPEEKKVILEKNLFKTKCLDMIRDACRILDDLILEKAI